MKLLAVLYAVSFAALVAASRVQETSLDENTNLTCVKDVRKQTPLALIDIQLP